MKTRIIIGAVLLILGIMIYLLLNFDSSPPPTTKLPAGIEIKSESQENRTQVPLISSSKPDDAEIDYSSLLNEEEKAHMAATGHVLTGEEREKLRRRKLGKDIASFMPTFEETKIMMDTPVEFYGQVLDQFDQPVVGAKIHCSWPYMGPPDLPLKMQSSAPDGLFEILGLRALSVYISVSPPAGYYESVSSSKNIQIAKAPERVLKNKDYRKFNAELKKDLESKLGAVEAYKGDKKKPVIFRLKKL